MPILIFCTMPKSKSFIIYLLITADDRPSTTHMHRSMAGDLSSSLAPMFSGSSGERKTSVVSHSSQPMLFTFDMPVRHSHAPLSNSAPQDYLLLHQCMSRKSESTR